MPKRPPNSPEPSGRTPLADTGHRGVVAHVLIASVGAYRRLLGPLLPASCRFAPTCSEFAIAALRHHGAARGGALAVRRLARCHPWNAGGYDPVPGREA